VSSKDPEVPAKRRKEEESKEDILEMMENTENPLRCPVRLYEFYLSKWWVYSVTKLLTAACFNYKMGTCLLFV